MQRAGVPGVAVGIVVGEEELVVAAGVTSVDDPLPISSTTLFQIGSITKTVLGSAVMRLVAAGRLDLDVPIRSVVPDFRLVDESVAARVTMRHLLTHVGGWAGRLRREGGRGDDALARFVAEMAELPQLVPLGSLFSYNSSGFCLAGRALELLTGRTFEGAMRELVLEPLGMARSAFLAEEVLGWRVVCGHVQGNHGPSVARPWGYPRALGPTAGMVSCPDDLLRYVRLHLGEAKHVLASGWLATMHKPQTEADRAFGHVALSWMTTVIDGVWVIRHGGTGVGQTSQVTIAPEHGFGVFVLSNAANAQPLNREIVRRLLHECLGASEPFPQSRPIDPGAAAEYVGRYFGETGEIQIAHTAGGLELDLRPRDTPGAPPSPGKPAPLGEVERDLLMVLKGSQQGQFAQFFRDAGGHVALMRYGGLLHPRAR